MHCLHRESGEERPAPILFYQYQKMASVVFFIQHIMVAVERLTDGALKFIKVKHL